MLFSSAAGLLLPLLSCLLLPLAPFLCFLELVISPRLCSRIAFSLPPLLHHFNLLHTNPEPTPVINFPVSRTRNLQSKSARRRKSCRKHESMAENTIPLILALFLAAAFPTFAADPDMLQDLCVADLKSSVKVNGFVCKEATAVTAEDFFFKGLASPGATNNSLGSVVTAANVEKIPGLNTLGVSLSRIDYAAGGLNPPHTHPRATEMVFVLYGSLDVGFITTANKLVSKTIAQGEIFVFPRGLVHFQKNNGDKPAAVISAFNSQLPGTQSIAATLFSASPPVPDNVLTKAFQIGTKEVEKIKSRFAPKS